MAEVTNKIIRGTFGALWMDNEQLANVKSFECKASMHYETVQVSGELCDQQRYTGYDLSGTVVLHKINTQMASKVASGMKTGSMPSIKFVTRLADPDSVGAERVAIYDVTFDEVTLTAFTNGNIGEESVPFKAGGYEYLDVIE